MAVGCRSCNAFHVWAPTNRRVEPLRVVADEPDPEPQPGTAPTLEQAKAALVRHVNAARSAGLEFTPPDTLTDARRQREEAAEEVRRAERRLQKTLPFDAYKNEKRSLVEAQRMLACLNGWITLASITGEAAPVPETTRGQQEDGDDYRAAVYSALGRARKRGIELWPEEVTLMDAIHRRVMQRYSHRPRNELRQRAAKEWRCESCDAELGEARRFCDGCIHDRRAEAAQ